MLAVLLFGGIMIRKFIETDKQIFIDMCMDFYSGEGVDHSIPIEYASTTFDKLLKSSPFVKHIYMKIMVLYMGMYCFRLLIQMNQEATWFGLKSFILLRQRGEGESLRHYLSMF